MGEAFICRGAGSFWNGNGVSVEFKPTILTTNGIYEAPSTGVYKISCVSGGGGGGGGCINTQDTSVSYYGYPGNKGGLQTKEVTLNEGDKVTVTIGIGGNPGAKNTTRTAITGGWKSTGGSGATGGSSAFGSHLTSVGGTAGVGGSYSNYWTNTPTSWNNRITSWNNNYYAPGTTVYRNSSAAARIYYKYANGYSSQQWTQIGYKNVCINNNATISTISVPASSVVSTLTDRFRSGYSMLGTNFWNNSYSQINLMGYLITTTVSQIVSELKANSKYTISESDYATNTWSINSTVNKTAIIYNIELSAGSGSGSRGGQFNASSGFMDTLYPSPQHKPYWTNTPTAWDNKQTIQDSCYHTVQQGSAWYLSGNDVTDQGSASTIRTYSGDGGASGAAGNSGFILIIPPQA